MSNYGRGFLFRFAKVSPVVQSTSPVQRIVTPHFGVVNLAAKSIKSCLVKLQLRVAV